MEQTRQSNRACGLIRLAVGLVTVLALTAVTGCAGDKTAPTARDSGQPAQALPPKVEPATSTAAPAAAPGSTGNPVVTSGAVKGSFPVKRAWAADFPGDYRVQLDLEFLCSVYFGIPHETRPGTYPIADKAAAAATNNGIVAEYADGCHANSDLYPSTKGTLTLTATGTKWSGTFEFTGQNANDKSKTVQVSGSFKDVSIT